jgi:hypothetical protein
MEENLRWKLCKFHSDGRSECERGPFCEFAHGDAQNALGSARPPRQFLQVWDFDSDNRSLI